MQDERRRKLEEAGWVFGDAEDFLRDVRTRSDEEPPISPKVSEMRGMLKGMSTKIISEEDEIRASAKRELLDELVEWIFSKHEHHTSDPEIGGPCPEGRPYVDSLDLEEHLKKIRSSLE